MNSSPAPRGFGHDSGHDSGQSAGRHVGIVAHTHWDREWYAPFQEFRIRLVELLDELLDLLEHDTSYRRFMLDGQTAVVDDYLTIRPDHEGRIRALVESGRLSIGPWAVLMDEFMVSGETIIRDLQAGMRRAAELGGAMEIGYLPDMFGHIAQMPQILRLAGFEHAVVWRGVPSAVDDTAFAWSAPDGSTVRAEFLYGSYSNGRDIPEDGAGLIRRAESYAAELGESVTGDMLLMNGTDHQLPQPWLGRVVAEANEIAAETGDGGYRFSVTSLPEYLGGRTTDGLTTWQGELRSGARSNILMGVASNRVDVHQLAAAAERSLERRAEPLAALLLADDPPNELLELAWDGLILNAAHDSSCACSADEVVEAVRVRYQEARQIADGVTRTACRRLAAIVDATPGSTVVLNPTARTRAGLVEVTAPGTGPFTVQGADGSSRPYQVIDEIGGEAFSTTVTGSKIRWVVEAMRGPEFRGVQIAAADITEHDGTTEVELQAAGPGGTATSLDTLREKLLARAEADPDTTFRVRMLRVPACRLAFATDPVDGFGWSTYSISEREGPPTDSTDENATVVGATLSNALLSATVDESDGTVSLRTTDGVEIHGANRLVDGGDGGDTYNYSPPTVDRIVDSPVAVSVTTRESGPVRSVVIVDATYHWPTAAVGDERRCEARTDHVETVRVETTYELRAGERFLRIHTEFDNRCRDHRLRAHVPLPVPVQGSDAECAFAVVHRGLEPEGGPHEFPLPTFPSRRFVDASDGDRGLALLHDGLLEYEITEGGTEIALTLLRSTGYLSRLEPALRPNPAGPADPLEGPQLQGRVALDYALLPHTGDWCTTDLYGAADEFLVPLERVRGGGAEPTRPSEGRLLRVDGAEVSALTTCDGAALLRLFNPNNHEASCTVERDGTALSGDIVDLRGRVEAPWSSPVTLAPGAIATLRVG
ncbi:MAG: alpha-mannosidase [Acidimicrobiia bacterium]|nr:alpha-mannosidase [Acidimicrobiia bacterium]